MEILALIILIIFSIIGFAAIFFTTFGTLLILLGSIIYSSLTNFLILDPKILIVLLLLYLCGEVLEYVFIIIGGKKFGASNSAIVGAIIGGILGAVLGTPLFGVGLILGTLLGIFLGAFLVEFFIQRDLVKSIKAGLGSVLGRIGSMVVKVIIAIIMLSLIVSKIAADASSFAVQI